MRIYLQNIAADTAENGETLRNFQASSPRQNDAALIEAGVQNGLDELDNITLAQQEEEAEQETEDNKNVNQAMAAAEAEGTNAVTDMNEEVRP